MHGHWTRISSACMCTRGHRARRLCSCARDQWLGSAGTTPNCTLQHLECCMQAQPRGRLRVGGCHMHMYVPERCDEDMQGTRLACAPRAPFRCKRRLGQVVCCAMHVCIGHMQRRGHWQHACMRRWPCAAALTCCPSRGGAHARQMQDLHRLLMGHAGVCIKWQQRHTRHGFDGQRASGWRFPCELMGRQGTY